MSKWMGEYKPNVADNILEFSLFGLARQGVLPDWVPMDVDKPIIDLGPGAKLVHGAIRLDWPEYDFEGYRRESEVQLPYEDNSIGGAVACHILEHLFDPRPIIQEVARVLAPGCPFNIVVPDANSSIYMQDVDHKTAFILDTWKTLLDNGGYYDNHAPVGLKLGANIKFAIKEGNEIIVTQLIKTESKGA